MPPMRPEGREAREEEPPGPGSRTGGGWKTVRNGGKLTNLYGVRTTSVQGENKLA